jgi:hypothetical protein
MVRGRKGGNLLTERAVSSGGLLFPIHVHLHVQVWVNVHVHFLLPGRYVQVHYVHSDILTQS